MSNLLSIQKMPKIRLEDYNEYTPKKEKIKKKKKREDS